MKVPTESGRLASLACGRCSAARPGSRHPIRSNGFRWRTDNPMSLTIDDVAKVALLARLRVSPDELQMFTGQLNSIMDYVAQLQQLETTDVEPLSHGIEVRNVFRDDVRGDALPREAALLNAPSATRRAFWFRRFWSEPLTPAHGPATATRTTTSPVSNRSGLEPRYRTQFDEQCYRDGSTCRLGARGHQLRRDRHRPARPRRSAETPQRVRSSRSRPRSRSGPRDRQAAPVR